LIGLVGLGWVEKERRCRFPHLEQDLPELGDRPLLMIHGGGDTYIKPHMARMLFVQARAAARAGVERSLWLVEGAKHNQAFHVAGEEYRRLVLSFFNQHLAGLPGIGDAPAGSRTDSGTGGLAPSLTSALPPPGTAVLTPVRHAQAPRQVPA